MSSNPYGDGSNRKKLVIPDDLSSAEIGSGVRILKTAHKSIELSEQDKKLEEYTPHCFVKNRRKNRFWLSRSVQRMCRSLKLEYNILRNEFTKTLENETAQVVTIPSTQRNTVRDALQVETEKFEKFILAELLPHSLALSSSIERATQVAKILSQDENISLDDKYLRMAHSDSITLKTISFFLSNSNVDKNIHDLYLEQFVMHRFAGGKSQIEKVLDQLSHNITKGNTSTNNLLREFIKKIPKPTTKVGNRDE